jgi:hypothetical protein
MTRQMKEVWLFGHLNTLGESKVQEKTEGDAKVVSEILYRLLEAQKATPG